MQHIQRPDLRPWISRDTFAAPHFLQQCLDRNVASIIDDAAKTWSQFLKHCVGQAKASAVAEDCDARHLVCEGEAALRAGNASHEASDWLSDVGLASVRFLHHRPACRAARVNYEKLTSAEGSGDACQVRPPPETGRPRATAASGKQPSAAPSAMQVVLSLQIFRPSCADAKKSQVAVDMEMEVLSCQTLLDVRRNICCASDITPHKQVPAAVTEAVGSAYFFIGDTFYNDTRSGCRDMSKAIVDWAQEAGRGVGPFHARDMEVSLAGLQLQPGLPYLYVHQGDCEHWLVLKDAWLLLQHAPCLAEYPKLLPMARRLQVKCDLCRTNVARWTTRDNRRLAWDPAFFCQDCHYAFNLDRQRRPIGRFHSQAFVDKSVML